MLVHRAAGGGIHATKSGISAMSRVVIAVVAVVNRSTDDHGGLHSPNE